MKLATVFSLALLSLAAADTLPDCDGGPGRPAPGKRKCKQLPGCAWRDDIDACDRATGSAPAPVIDLTPALDAAEAIAYCAGLTARPARCRKEKKNGVCRWDATTGTCKAFGDKSPAAPAPGPVPDATAEFCAALTPKQCRNAGNGCRWDRVPDDRRLQDEGEASAPTKQNLGKCIPGTRQKDINPSTTACANLSKKSRKCNATEGCLWVVNEDGTGRCTSAQRRARRRG